MEHGNKTLATSSATLSSACTPPTSHYVGHLSSSTKNKASKLTIIKSQLQSIAKDERSMAKPIVKLSSETITSSTNSCHECNNGNGNRKPIDVDASRTPSIQGHTRCHKCHRSIETSNELKSTFYTPQLLASDTLEPTTTSSSAKMSDISAITSSLKDLKLKFESHANAASHVQPDEQNVDSLSSSSHISQQQTFKRFSNTKTTSIPATQSTTSVKSKQVNQQTAGLLKISNAKSEPMSTVTTATNTTKTLTNHLDNLENNTLTQHELSFLAKAHSSKCNLVLRRMRRGNKRSKSLPSKFNIDSLLEYLNYSMILNKHELKKLHHQRNLLFMNSSNSSNHSQTNLNNLVLSSCFNNSFNGNTSNLSRQILNQNHHTHQLSSGYNSENSSNSTTTPINSNYHYQTSTANSSCHTPTSLAIPINFYKLSLNHLHFQFPTSLNPQCTCGLDMAAKSPPSIMQKNCRQFGIAPLCSSPKTLPGDCNNESDEDDEDDDEDDEEEDEDYNEDFEAENIKKINDLELIKQNEMKKCEETTKLISEEVNKKIDTKAIASSKDDSFPILNQVTRAPGTSHCQHTVRIDVRRVRSYRDLSQCQLIFSPKDFIFKEKLGEGFFANVKKIVSKQSNCEMVLKELKLSCLTGSDTADSNETVDETDQSQTKPKSVDVLLNYAELNAAHKSFLKEAQVLRNLNHPNVIKFMGIMFTKEKQLNLILEYISGGTLKDIIHNISNVLPWKLRVGYAKDIAAAMQYLHSLNIIHRDLKSDNCLVRENGRTVVVADFGLSRIISNNNSHLSDNNSFYYLKNVNSQPSNYNNKLDTLSNVAETLLMKNNISSYAKSASTSASNSFIVAAKRKLKRRGDSTHHRKQRYAVVGNSFSMAPEMLKHQIYDERVDIFSFGIICCEIIGRVQADPDYLPRTSDFGLNVELFRKKYCEADCPKHFIKIAIACCELEPEKRPPFSKTHVWLETILSHMENNNPIPKNLLKNILDQNNTKRPLSSLINNGNIAPSHASHAADAN